MKERLEQRMYFLNNMYFMGIQAGIQAGHAAIEYALKFGHTEEFKNFAEHDKTWIILVGGFSVGGGPSTDPAWGMNYALYELQRHKIPHAPFHEAMANNCLSSIAFLVNEKVWNKVKYPEPSSLSKDTPFNDAINLYKISGLNDQEAFLRQFLKPYPLAK